MRRTIMTGLKTRGARIWIIGCSTLASGCRADGDRFRARLGAFVKAGVSVAIQRAICSKVEKQYEIDGGHFQVPIGTRGARYMRTEVCKSTARRDIFPIWGYERRPDATGWV